MKLENTVPSAEWYYPNRVENLALSGLTSPSLGVIVMKLEPHMIPYNNQEMSSIITSRMNERSISINQLSEMLDVAYESARRIVRGSPPDKPILRILCEKLDLDFDRMRELSVQTHLRRKYGDAYLRVVEKNPELEPIEKAWPLLTPDQRKDATAMILAWANRSK